MIVEIEINDNEVNEVIKQFKKHEECELSNEQIQNNKQLINYILSSYISYGYDSEECYNMDGWCDWEDYV